MITQIVGILLHENGTSSTYLRACIICTIVDHNLENFAELAEVVGSLEKLLKKKSV